MLALESMAHATWWRQLPRVWRAPKELSFHVASEGLPPKDVPFRQTRRYPLREDRLNEGKLN